MWIVFCWKFKKLFIVFNVGEYIYCSIVFLLDNISWVFRLRDVFYIKKNCNFFVVFEFRLRWRLKKDEYLIL